MRPTPHSAARTARPNSERNCAGARLAAACAGAAPAALLSGILLSSPSVAHGQTWNGSASDLWSNGANWTPNTVPNSASATATVTNATNNPVLIDIAPTLANLTVGSTNSVNLNNAESLTIAGGPSAGSLDLAGSLTLNSGGNFTDLILGGTSGSTVTLSGGGFLSLSNAPNNRIYSSTGDTLVNSTGNTIQGAGQVGINSGGFGFTFNNQGTVNANQSNVLQVAPSGTVTNTGTLEATSGGQLHLFATINNAGGSISASGASSVVDIFGSTITGGTISTSTGGVVQNSGTASLDGLSVTANSTFTAPNGSTTDLFNTITLAPTAVLLANSGGNLTDLRLHGSVTFTGGGTVTFSNTTANRIYGNTGSDSLLNDTNNTIQGAGQIGINSGGFGFSFTNKGTVNANQSNVLQVAPSGTVTNTGTLEATSGGQLHLFATINNAGGLIQAAGSGSTVELSGSTITGGTISTSTGGVVQNSGTASLDGLSVTANSTFTAPNGSTTDLFNTITLAPTAVLLANSGGNLTDLRLHGSVTFTGGGTVTFSNTTANRIYGNTGSDSLLNDTNNTIQGAGQIGINSGGFGFSFTNKGTVNANQSSVLQVAPAGTVTNTGTLEATAGGQLHLFATINNAGGLIQAAGSGSTVELSGSTIAGGTFTTSGGGVIQNSGTTTVDGSTNSPTISGGSTVTLTNGATTTLLGTINNNGTIAQNSSGNFTDLLISGSVVLNGTGSLSLSDNVNNRVYASGADSLTNGANHTIQGGGQLGINNGGFAFTLTNNGTILANKTNALTIAPSGNTTNNGTFQANSGSTLFMNGALTDYNAGSSTLTGGSYNAFSGSILLSQANTGTGAVISTNAATILLDGPTAKVADASGNDIVRGFIASNTAAGHFTIQNAANVTSVATSDFTNAGTMGVGANSTFTVGGSNKYINTGLLQGTGTVSASGGISNSGAVSPGFSPGQLDLTGDYSQAPAGSLNIELGGLTPATQYDVLNVSGPAALDGILNVTLINAFTPSGTESFDILHSTGLNGTKFSTVNLPSIPGENLTVVYTPTDVRIDASPVPEPAGLAVLGLVAGVLMRRRRAD